MTLRISHKLGMLVLLSIGVCILISFMSWSKIKEEIAFAKNLNEQRLEPVWMLEHLSRLYSHDVSDTAHQLRAQMIFWGEAEKTIIEADEKIQTLWSQYSSRTMSGDERQLLEELQPSISMSLDTVKELERLVAEKSNYELGKFVDMKMYPGLKPLFGALDQLIAQQTTLAEAEQQAADERLQETTQELLIVLSILVISQFVFSFLLSKSILNPIEHVRASVSKVIGSMDFSNRVEVDSQCEIGELAKDVNGMIAVLDELLISLQPVTNKLEDSAGALVSGSREVDRQVELQNNELQEVKLAVESVYCAGQEVSKTASLSYQQTESATTAAQTGSERLAKTINAINQLAERVKQSSSDMEKLSASSDAIGGVLEVISEIAEQTNLLALNAAIEAARAGDQGRGFAVVADEVRQLAQRTATSTNEIRSMVDAIQGSSQQVSASLSESVGAATKSVEQAESAGEIIAEILQSIALVSHQSEDITQRSSQQIDLSQKLNEQAGRLSELSKQTAGLSEDSARASEVVSDISLALTEQLKIYSHSSDKLS